MPLYDEDNFVHAFLKSSDIFTHFGVFILQYWANTNNLLIALQTAESNDLKSQINQYRDTQAGDEESSYSSFYSSFLKTDTGSGSNDDCNNMENQTNKSDDVSWHNLKAMWMINIFVFLDDFRIVGRKTKVVQSVNATPRGWKPYQSHRNWSIATRCRWKASKTSCNPIWTLLRTSPR